MLSPTYLYHGYNIYAHLYSMLICSITINHTHHMLIICMTPYKVHPNVLSYRQHGHHMDIICDILSLRTVVI